jgi:autotransporter-associated beta strand protein
LTIGAGGITKTSDSGVVNFGTTSGSVGVSLGADQTWTNNSSTTALNIGTTFLSGTTTSGTLGLGSRTLTLAGVGNFNFGAVGATNSVIGVSVGSTLIKDGTGTLTIGGDNAFSGATLISGGTLGFTSNGDINASSGITINGSTAKLLQTSSTAMVPTVTLTQGTLTGSGTVNTVNVADDAGNIVSNNNGVAGAALTVGDLTFAGAASVNTYNDTTAAAIVTTNLNTDAAGTVTINPTVPPLVAGAYDLISYTAIGGAGAGQVVLGTITGATQRQNPVFGNSGTAFTLTVGADNPPYWSGEGDGNWNTSSPNNWKFISDNNPTTYIETDIILFNDLATPAGPVTVDIDAADVSPTSTTFDNITKNYILDSSNDFGIATGTLTKSGTGSLTLNTFNTFTGNTTINDGSLIIGEAGLLGGGNYAGTISNDGSFICSSSAAQNLAGIVSGTGSITQNGPGNLTLSAANSFAGGLEVKGGTVILTNSTAAGTGTIGFDTGGETNASIQLNGAIATFANPIAVSSGSIGTNTIANVGTGTVIMSGAITLNSGTTLTVDNSSINNSAVDLGTGIISGDGSLVATGTSTGSFAFKGASTFTGGTTLSGSALFIPAASSTGSGAGTTDGVFGTGTLTLGTISMRSTNTADTTIGNTLILGGNLTAVTATAEKNLIFSGPATLTGNRTITSQVGATVAGKSLTFSGVIGDGGNNYGITKEGTGVLLLNGANTYAGTTTVNAGTLSITDSAALGSTTGATTINGGNGANSVILNLSGATSDLTIAEPLNFFGNATGRARLSNNSARDHTLTGPIDVSSDTNFAQFYSDGAGSITVSGDVTGTMSSGMAFVLRGTSTSLLNRLTGSINLVGSITKTDAGTWLLGAPGKTYSWMDTGVANGTLRMGEANVLPSTTMLIMGNPTGGSTGTLNLNGFDQTVAGIIYSGQGSATGTRTITSATSAVLTVNTAIDSITTGINTGANNVVLTGALSLTKQGAGTLALNGVNTYGGDTTVNEGILSITKAASPADANTGNDASTVTISATPGATLDLAFTGTDTVDKLFIGATQQPAGVYGALLSGAQFEIAQITGTGTLTVSSGPAAGGYDGWADTNADGEAAHLDFDKDGVSNGVEFFMNAPAGFTASPQLNSSNTITWSNGGNIPASEYGTQFVVQTSSNLSTWTNVLAGDLTTNTDGPGGSLTYTLTGGSPRFVRLSVTPN